MTECNQERWLFPSVKSRVVEAEFSGGNVSSDGGLLILRQVDRKLGLSKAISAALKDPRDPQKIIHSQLSMVKQRVYGLCLGYEDLNDHDSLREDVAWQSAVDRDEVLGSSPTLCRMENRANRKAAVGLTSVLVEAFIASFKEAPSELILDFDATDDRVHGQQQGRSFHGYYGDWCFLPLYVFCGQQLLVSYLRRSNIDAARHAWAVLSLLVKRLRKQWPHVKIIMRADSGFCRWKMLRWCERHEVYYVLGLAKNTRLNALNKGLLEEAKIEFATSKVKARIFGEFQYKAGTWDTKRRVIAKAEYGEKGSNPRYIVTNLDTDPQKLYDNVYCQRGEMENRIKEQQLGLFSDRTSCTHWWPNQFRLLLSSMAYVLMETVRRVGLRGTELAHAQVNTLRLKLLKIGAVVIRNSRRIRFLFPTAYPYQQIFGVVVNRFSSA